MMQSGAVATQDEELTLPSSGAVITEMAPCERE